MIENEEHIIRSVDEVNPGEAVQIRLNDGRLDTIVEKITKNEERTNG